MIRSSLVGQSVFVKVSDGETGTGLYGVIDNTDDSWIELREPKGDRYVIPLHRVLFIKLESPSRR